MTPRIHKRFLPVFLLCALPASASSVGVYVSASNFYCGDASYATAPGISIYSGGGLNYNPDSNCTNTFSSTATQPGATTAGLVFASNSIRDANTQESSTSYASLASGIMRSQISTIATSYSRAITGQILKDSVTFAVSGAPTAQIQVNAHLSGGATGVGPGAGQETNSLNFGFGGGSFQWEAFVSSNGKTGISENGASGYVPPSGWDSYQFTNESVTGFDFSGLLTVSDGQKAGFFENLSLDCSNGAVCDFSNTSRFSLSLPSNVSFTSDSGVLLTAPTTATPEPGTIALILPTLAAAAFAWRRKKA